MSSRNVKSCAQYLMLLALVVLAIILLQTETSTMNNEMLEYEARLRGPLPSDDPIVMTLLRQKYISPPSGLPYNLSTDSLKAKTLKIGSSEFISNYTLILFKDEPPGFFVEAGAADGEKGSNSLWLEKEQGWTGLLVEADQNFYRQLEKKQRKAWTSHTCLSVEVYPVEEIFVSFLRIKQTDNAFLNSLYNGKASSHLFGVQLDNDRYEFFNRNTDASYSKVQCFPLASYLMALNISTVDFLSLDIQGAEKSVLRSFPWDKISIRSMVVEIVHWDTFDQEFVDFMKEKQFELISHFYEDYIFVKQGDSLLKKVNLSQPIV